MKKTLSKILILCLISFLSFPFTYAQEELEEDKSENPIQIVNDKLSYDLNIHDTEIIRYMVNTEEEYEVKIHNSDEKIIEYEEGDHELTVRAIKAGKASITIIVYVGEDSFDQELNFNVKKKEEKASIKFNKKSQSVDRGDDFVIDFEVTPKDLDLARIIWESSDPRVASVENGSVFAHRVGTVTISGRIDGIKTSMEVSVKAPLEMMEFNPNSVTLGLNETISIPEIIYVPYDTTVDRTVSYEISDKEIVAIQNNKIVGLKSGTTTILAKIEDIETELFVKVDEQTLASDAHTLLLENTEIDEDGFHLNIRDFERLEKDQYELYLPKKEILAYMSNRKESRLIIHLEKEIADDNLRNMTRLAIDKDILLQLGAQKLEIVFMYEEDELYRFRFEERAKETYNLSFNFDKIRPDNPVYAIVKNDHSFAINFVEEPLEGMTFSIHDNVLSMPKEQIYFLYGLDNKKIIENEENIKAGEDGYVEMHIKHLNNILSLSPINQTNNLLVMGILSSIIVIFLGYGVYRKYFKLRNDDEL